MTELLVRHDGRWRFTTVLGVAAVVTGGVVLIGTAYGVTPPPAPAATAVGPASGRDDGVRPMAASRPTRVDIDAIGVHAPLTTVGVDVHGAVEAPPLDRPHLVGWYRLGPSPGAAGNAVLLGHVDTDRSGPAVFHGLGRLDRGAEVRVTRADGRVAVFRVEDVALFDKQAFPAALVYGPAARAQLRLVTCGGTYDRARGGYQGNVVATASLVGTR